jgi:hypothetical protein
VLTWAGGSLAASALSPLLAGCEQGVRSTPPGCIEPRNEQQHTLAAFIDAVVPGYSSDPAGAPGAIDACGLNVALDPALPLASLAGLLALALDGAASTLYLRPLGELGQQEREAVLAQVEIDVPEATLAIRLARTAFYASQYSDLAERWLGVHGPNLGYLEDGFSFVEPQCDEMTDDGNLP